MTPTKTRQEQIDDGLAEDIRNLKYQLYHSHLMSDLGLRSCTTLTLRRIRASLVKALDDIADHCDATDQ